MMRAVLLLLALLPPPLWALEPGEALPDPALEARARAIGRDLRCLVCQNQSIDDSDAGLAKDLRHFVRQRLLSGDDDEAVRQAIVKRYGDYVLLTPPLKAETLPLWLGPLLISAAALVLAAGWFRRKGAR